MAEEQKRAQQVHAFIRRAEPAAATLSWIDRLNPYRRMKANPRAINVQALPENLVLPLKKSVVREYRTPGEANVRIAISSRKLSDQIFMITEFDHYPNSNRHRNRPGSSWHNEKAHGNGSEF